MLWPLGARFESKSKHFWKKNLRSWRGGQDPTLIIECLGSSPSQVKFFCLMVLVILVQMHYLNSDLFVYWYGFIYLNCIYMKLLLINLICGIKSEQIYSVTFIHRWFTKVHFRSIFSIWIWFCRSNLFRCGFVPIFFFLT